MLFSSRQEGEGHAEKEGGHGGDFIQLLKSVSAKVSGSGDMGWSLEGG